MCVFVYVCESVYMCICVYVYTTCSQMKAQIENLNVTQVE